MPVNPSPLSVLASRRLSAFVVNHVRDIRRPFSVSPTCRSRIGATPLSVPPEVTLTLLDPPPPRKGAKIEELKRSLSIKGPLGEMKMSLPGFVKVDYNTATRKVKLKVEDAEERRQREMWGTTRAYIANHIVGVSEGHTAILRLSGVGYRATLANESATKKAEYEGQQFLILKLGYAQLIELGVPEGVRASTPQPSRIVLSGIEKEAVLEFAATIRKWRPPEPYKGKGIFVNGETIKLKAKKIS